MKLFTLCLFWAMSATANINPFVLDSEKTLYVVDGDSISLQMRIQGIDTPEIRQKCQKTATQTIDCGRLSKDYLIKTLKNLPGKLSIEPIGTDHYQRVLVNVYKGGIDVAKLMVEAGMAFSYKDTYRQEQALAKKEKLGFWGFYTPPIKPYQWRKMNRH